MLAQAFLKHTPFPFLEFTRFSCFIALLSATFHIGSEWNIFCEHFFYTYICRQFLFSSSVNFFTGVKWILNKNVISPFHPLTLFNHLCWLNYFGLLVPLKVSWYILKCVIFFVVLKCVYHQILCASYAVHWHWWITIIAEMPSMQ